MQPLEQTVVSNNITSNEIDIYTFALFVIHETFDNHLFKITMPPDKYWLIFLFLNQTYVIIYSKWQFFVATKMYIYTDRYNINKIIIKLNTSV